MSVGREIACRPDALQFRPQPREMSVRRLRDMDVRQRKPSFQLAHDLRDGEGSLDNSAICGDAHKPQHRRPGQTNALGA